MSTVANSSALLPVQGALFALLKAPGSALGAQVHDEVPENAAYPYVTIGDAVETPDNDQTTFGSRVAGTLHIWSEYRGYAQALAIHDRLIALLDHQQLTIAGRGLVAVRHEQTITMRDPDPAVRHVAVRFVFESFPQS